MSRLFVGGLANDVSRGDLEREFEGFGRIDDIFVARNPPGFGFVVFSKSRDADYAIKKMDGHEIRGEKIRVEAARERGAGRSGGGGGGGYMANVKCYNCGEFGHMSRSCSRGQSYGYSSSRRSRSRSR